MLNILRCGLYSSGREKIYGDIAKRVAQGEKTCLIVPEQQTVMTEGALSQLLPASSALCFEVTNFTRLANTTFRSLGGLSLEYCDNSKRALIMWRTLSELMPVLNTFSVKGEITSGIVNSALSAVSEMQSFGIHPGELVESLDNPGVSSDRRLVDKISDLAQIYTLYKGLLKEKYSDTGDDSEIMIKKLTENPDFLSDTEIFIEGFTSFTEPQYRLIGLLARRSSVTVLLAYPGGSNSAFEFSELKKCQSHLNSASTLAGGEVRLVKIGENRKNAKEELVKICDNLWSTIVENENITLQNPSDLRIFEAETPFDECEFIAADIKRRVMEGASFSDFAIIARDASLYSGVLDGALRLAGIPAFTSYRRDINEFEAVKLIYTAYSAIGGFRREDVLSYAKCSLSGVSREECDEFEMYVNKWQISGKRFVDGELWNMNPKGYTRPRDGKTEVTLLRINAIRNKIISPLQKLAHSVELAKTTREQATALLDFLIEIGMEEALARRGEKLEAMGEGDLARENRRLWKTILGALESLVEILGDNPADRRSFLAEMQLVFSTYDVGAIPAHVDEVTVGSADMLRLYGKPHVYLIGVNEGVFPGTVSDNSYFSDRDKSVLSEAGLSVTPDLVVKGARELYIFSRAFSYADKSVTISYSAYSSRFKSMAPSGVVKRIYDLTGGAVKPVKISSLSLSDRVFSPSDALLLSGDECADFEEIRDALIDTGHGREVEISEGNISNAEYKLSDEITAMLYNGQVRMTQSIIETYVKCPLSHFCRYTAKLTEEEIARFDAASIGSFVHSILENFFRTLSEEKRNPGQLTADERVALTKRVAENYISDIGDEGALSSAKTKIKLNRLVRAALPVVEGLCEEFGKSKFAPKFFELSIKPEKAGDKDCPSALKIQLDENTHISITGEIDRVDTYHRDGDVYVRVVDYKTGQKKFSPEDMKEGLNLQMFLYLKAIIDSKNEGFRERIGVSEGGEIIPAGVIYLKTSMSDVKVDCYDDEIAKNAVKDAEEREGMVLRDDGIISAMGLEYTPVYSKRSPDSISKAKQKFLFDREEFDAIMQTVEGAVIQVAEKIRGGEIEAKPRCQKGKSPCEYCQFKAICRSSIGI